MKPTRRISPPGTYFITTSTAGRRALFFADRLVDIVLGTFFHYRDAGNYLLHDFVLMPDHFHLLVTPAAGITIEKAMQFVKGGSSYRLKKEGGFSGDVWQRGFEDHRIRDEDDYRIHRAYIRQNPVKRGLVLTAEAYRPSSASPGFCDRTDGWTSAAKAVELIDL